MANQDERERIDILFALAGARLASGDRAGAERGYRAVLELEPAHAEALHRLGSLLRAAGATAAAIRLISRSLAVRPGDPYALNNLGGAFRDAGKPGLAYLSLSAAVDKVPGDARFRVNLGAALLDLHRYPEAADTLHEAARLDPTGRDEAHHLLASTLYRLHLGGGAADAVARARTWLAACPDSALARHSVAALAGEPPPAASADWVRTTFDRFGPSFDTHLRSLSYGVPARIGALVRDRIAPAEARLLDLGCGTGLCGDHLRPVARHLVGVDLSPGMLAQAEAKGIYDRLVEGDMVDVLRGEAAGFWDAIVAADVFIYVGDLVPSLCAVAAGLRPGGLFLFSVETVDPSTGGRGYQLHASGRYRHCDDYVRQAVAGPGLALECVEDTVIRMERGAPVPGRIFTVVKPE